jgi:hypothetical protein
MGSSGEKSAKKQKREKTPGKSASKKRDRDPETPADDATNAEEKMNPVCAIAKPLADAKLTKKLLKVVKKGIYCLLVVRVSIEEGEEGEGLDFFVFVVPFSCFSSSTNIVSMYVYYI